MDPLISCLQNIRNIKTNIEELLVQVSFSLNQPHLNLKEYVLVGDYLSRAEYYLQLLNIEIGKTKNCVRQIESVEKEKKDKAIEQIKKIEKYSKRTGTDLTKFQQKMTTIRLEVPVEETGKKKGDEIWKRILITVGTGVAVSLLTGLLMSAFAGKK